MSNWELVGKILCKHVEEDFGIWTEGAVYKVYKLHDGILLYDNYQNSRLSKSIESFIKEMSKGCVIFEEVSDKKRVNPNVLKCIKAGASSDWWTSGKLYPIIHKRTHVYIVDDEGDKRCKASIKDIVDDFRHYDGTIFEYIYYNIPETYSIKELVEKLEKDVERLNKDSKHLVEKAERINAQAAILDTKAVAVESDLQTLRKYI